MLATAIVEKNAYDVALENFDLAAKGASHVNDVEMRCSEYPVRRRQGRRYLQPEGNVA